jgi:hypothetical protein
MSHICNCCGKELDEMPRYFMFKLPQAYVNDSDLITFDNKFTCRSNDGRFFISCEIELPLTIPGLDPLGFICWVEVTESIYNDYANYRDNEEALSEPAELIDGVLANAVTNIEGSFGQQVKFKVLCADPTPYIKWVAPGSLLSQLVNSGVGTEYWHSVVGD